MLFRTNPVVEWQTEEDAVCCTYGVAGTNKLLCRLLFLYDNY